MNMLLMMMMQMLIVKTMMITMSVSSSSTRMFFCLDHDDDDDHQDDINEYAVDDDGEDGHVYQHRKAVLLESVPTEISIPSQPNPSIHPSTYSF